MALDRLFNNDCVGFNSFCGFNGLNSLILINAPALSHF